MISQGIYDAENTPSRLSIAGKASEGLRDVSAFEFPIFKVPGI